jgi:hypothetical protein
LGVIVRERTPRPVTYIANSFQQWFVAVRETGLVRKTLTVAVFSATPIQVVIVIFDIVIFATVVVAPIFIRDREIPCSFWIPIAILIIKVKGRIRWVTVIRPIVQRGDIIDLAIVGARIATMARIKNTILAVELGESDTAVITETEIAIIFTVLVVASIFIHGE